jgi:dihydrofolate reductase
MATVVADMSVSLDGFVADAHDEVGPLFDWYQTGPVTTPSADERWTFHTDEASAKQLREALTSIGALICGRRLFDLTKAWGGRHPIGCHVFVVTHTVPKGWPQPDAPFTFVTEGDRIVAVATPTTTQQCLNAGLLDAIRVNLVPVMLGDGIRWLDNLRHTPVMLDDPIVTEGMRVTHLEYRVRRR